VETWKFFHHSGEYSNSWCGPERADPGWISLSFRDPSLGDDEVAANHVGPIVYTGNWTGLQCGHNYVFRLKSEWNVEAYEANADWKKIRDLEKVPP
jgi:hypothetical protein